MIGIKTNKNDVLIYRLWVNRAFCRGRGTLKIKSNKKWITVIVVRVKTPQNDWGDLEDVEGV